MLKVTNISYHYEVEKPILTNISFTLQKGENLCVMGESGCGKSTLLKAVYGLLNLTKGVIFWNKIQVLGPAHYLVPGMDFFKHVAQDFDLMPFISVRENIKKYLSRFYPEESEKRTQELLEVIEMTKFANEKVKNLSGGQQQRVAIARALAKEPELLLLDEPFSQIDNFKKNSLRRKLFKYLKEKNIACIVATHDGNDALSFADKMLVIREAKIISKGCPKKIYNYPKNKYTASLFDDVNEIIINKTTILRYSHQLKIVTNSSLQGIVTNTYFKGFYWLIEINYKGKIIFISHNNIVETGTIINFEISF